MSRFYSPLDNVRVAAPCNADWEQMIGNERARFCGQCNLNVYNLSSMTRSEAESFIAQNEGRLCVRYYHRADGSVITENCPVGLRAIRRKMSYLARVMISAVLSFLAGVASFEILLKHSNPGDVTGQLVREPSTFPMVASPFSTETPVIMGDMIGVEPKLSQEPVTVGKLMRINPHPNQPLPRGLRHVHR